MRKKLFFNVVILIVCLGFAYYASLPSKKREMSGKEWLRINSEEIEKVVYESKRLFLEVKSVDSERFWITHAIIGDGEKKVDSFKASKKINDLLKFMNPLWAIRDLGDVGNLDKKEFGLEGGAPLFRVILKDNRSYGFRIGKKSFGSKSLFALDINRNQVILINGYQIENLKKAKSRLFERKVIDIDMGDVKKAEIRTGEFLVHWDHSEKDKKGNLHWRKDEPGSSPDSSYNNWMAKIGKLRIIQYATSKETNRLSNEKPFLTISYLDSGKNQIEKLEFWKVTGITAKGNKDQFWVKSNFTSTYGRVNYNRAFSIERDISIFIEPK